MIDRSAVSRALAKAIAALFVSLGRVGTLIFTGGIGENAPSIRATVIQQLGLFGFELDPQRNAQIAYDAQVVQRVLWRLRASSDDELRRDLADYLDAIALTETQQAVA